MASKEKKRRGGSLKIDFATIGGLIVAFGAIAAGLQMEGGKLQDISQVTSALIVIGGTFGACMVSTPGKVLWGAIKQFGAIFLGSEQSPDVLIEEIIGFAVLARRDGILALEQPAESIADPFLRKAMSLAVDGVDTGRIRETMMLEIATFEKHAEAEARVFEAAGGYSPTIGIIGAVIGLIQVMKNLANIEEVGRGIAVAFVATIYGVAVANLVFLPAASKLKARVHQAAQMKELALEGVIGIAEGLNQKLIRIKLEAFVHGPTRAPKPDRLPAESAAPVEA